MVPSRRAFACCTFVVVLAVLAHAQEFLYALNNYTNAQLLKIDPADWSLVESHSITNEEALFGGLASDAAKDLYSIDGYNDANSDRTFRIDRTTGAGTVVGDTGFNWNFRFVYAHPITDVLYGGRDSQLYTIDRTTGQATYVTNITGGGIGQVSAIAIDSQGNGYCVSISTRSLYTLNLTTGEAVLIGSTGRRWQDIAFDGNDVLYGADFDSPYHLYSIDTSTGASSPVDSSRTYRGLTFVVEGAGCAGDLDGDGDTDQSDLGILLASWGIDDGGDLDNDGDTDQADLGVLLADWGCGT